MMTVPGWLQCWLKIQPEYGMGYQRGIAKLSTGSVERGVILNGSIFAKEDELRSLSASEIGNVGTVVRESSLSIVDINLIARPPESLRGVRRVRTLVVKGTAVSARLELSDAEKAKLSARVVFLRPVRHGGRT